MPSLRRNFSSPLVRSSPYSSALNGSQVSRGHAHRRSSGSHTTNRRVLADIDWWRVTDGQSDPSVADQESEDHNRGDAQPVAAAIPRVTFHDTQTGVDHPLSILSLPWPAATPASTTECSLPTAEFAALSLAPQTPIRRHLALDTTSANSSVESTPEGPTPIEFDGLRLDLEGLGPIFFGDKFAPRLTPAPSFERGCLFSDSPFLVDDDDCFGFPSSSMFTSGFVC